MQSIPLSGSISISLRAGMSERTRCGTGVQLYERGSGMGMEVRSMTVTRLQRNSETNEIQNGSTGFSERQRLLKTCQQLFAKELTEEEIKFWIAFLTPLSLAEVRYAFDNWNRNGRFFPKPKDIGDLCEAFKLSEINKQRPIGCQQCDWSGFIEVRRKGVERFVRDCPCRQDLSLRQPKRGQLATREELKEMMAAIRKLADEKAMEKPKPKQLSGIIPTSTELARHLQKHRHVLAKTSLGEEL